MDESTKIWTVSEVNHSIKEIIEGTFYPLWLVGEIGNLTIHRSGHVYFNLKDKRSQISAVFFGGAGVARQLTVKEGTEVEIYGKLMVYEPRGNYQLNVKVMRTKGIGDLQKQFEELKQKLLKEGLFDENRKKRIPYLPQCIGVISSPEGAALQDFLKVVSRRYSGMHIKIFPAAVQGPSSAVEISSGVEFFNGSKSCDVIVITRGGGSLEDLWSFNDENLARVIAKSKIPIISAVGHEVDFTICDFVAVLRVSTPSAAAELVVKKREELLESLLNLNKRMFTAMKLKLSMLRTRVERVSNHYVLREPMNVVRSFQQKTDELNLRLIQGARKAIDRATANLEKLTSQLRSLNPKNVLSRGYSILLTEVDGTTVTNSKQVGQGDCLKGVLAKGELRLQVKNENESPVLNKQ